MNDYIETTDQGQDFTPVIASDTLLTIAENAEKRADAMNKIKRVAIKLTNKYDWTDQDGKPYLQASGAEKIARLFGIGWRVSGPECEKDEDGHFAYTYKGEFWLAGATIEAIGTRSSRDGFFNRYKYVDGQKTQLPPSEYDKGDIKKSAYTNCIGNGITRILGIRNLTYDDLEAFAGITREMLGKVDYKKDGKNKTDIKSEGALTAKGGVADIRKKSGTKKDGKTWTNYVITSNGAEYKTFSESLAQTAKEAMEAGLQVEITYKAGQYGNDIENLVKLEPTAADVRVPGEEG